jgi:DNA-binding beta-propeller fold protein YncE
MAAPMIRFRGPFMAAIVGALLLLAPLAQAAGPSHPLLWTISEVPSEHPPLPEFLEDPCGLAVDSGGTIYASDYYHDRLEAFGPSGGFAGRFNGIEPLDGPCGLAFGPAGDLYVNVYHRNVVRFAPGEPFSAGSGTVIAGVGADGSHPTGVAVDPASGDVFVDERTHVAEYSPTGALLAEIGLGTLEDGYGIAVSGFPATAGYLYVPDAADNAVKVYDPSASLTDPIMVIDGQGTPQGGFVSLADSAVAIDQTSGHLYVSDDLQPRYSEHPEGVIDEFNAAGDYRGQLPKLPLIVNGGPPGLAVDNSPGPTKGRVYTTSGNGEKASIFAYGPTAPAHVLTVAKTGAGTGTVKSEPAGIDCASACAAEYNVDEAVTLTAVPDPGSAFAGWTVKGAPGICTEIAACHLTLGADTEVSAEFEVAPQAPATVPSAPALSPPAVSAAGAAAPNSAATIAPAAQPSSPAPPALHPRAVRRHRHRHHRRRRAALDSSPSQQ